MGIGQPDSGARKVVVLHDSGYLGSWRQAFNNALYERLNGSEGTPGTVRVSVEYLGLDQLGPAQAPTEQILSLKQKNLADPAAVVVGVLSRTSDFLSRWGAEIYGETPQIFLTTNSNQPLSIERQGGIQRIILNADITIPIADTLSLVGSLRPNTKQLILVAGAGTYGSLYLDNVTSVAADRGYSFEILPIQGLPVDQLIQQLADFEASDSSILYLPFNVDNTGRPQDISDVLKRIHDNVDLPIFSLFDVVLGEGIIGGKMGRPAESGFAIANKIDAVLSGGSADFGTIEPLPYHYYFDARELAAWEIDRAQLPPNSFIEFEDLSVWQSYKWQLITVALFFFALLCLIIALVTALKRRRIAEQNMLNQAKALGEQINMFESVINSIPDAILISDSEGTVVSTNRSVRTVFDYESSELVGRKTFTLLRSWNDTDTREENFDNQEKELVKPVILHYRKRDGEVFQGETIRTKIISAHGEDLGYFTLVRNVSRRLLKEQEQKQRQKMEALGNLVGGIAHDFNNVLGVISAYAEVLQTQVNLKESGDSVTKILKATQRGSDICNQIMSFSRDTGVEQLNINLLDVVKETLKLLSVSIPTRINIQLDCHGNSFLVKANFTQMQQIIMNLATNASHAIGEKNGSLKITVSSERTTQEKFLFQGTLPAGNYVVLRVSDTGSGMEDKVLEKIFEPFFTTKEKHQGTGMGMAMVYKILRSHGANIDISSELGVGTEISIFLPELEVSPSIENLSADAQLIEGNGETILLIDDEEDLLDSVAQLLTNIGYRVEAFSDPAEALATFRDRPSNFDLVLSDQTMPKLSGVELAQAIHGIEPHLPIVLCTGYSDILDQASVGQLGLKAVIRKPFSIAVVSRILSTALSPAPAELVSPYHS
ncbi:MAG: hypothetical protein DHS20C12_16170 [Pseudohongiella sp.]|nr:MAG: hypothetical protein DHS20C12_16170 [Pseudohongiella sp.]